MFILSREELYEPQDVASSPPAPETIKMVPSHAAETGYTQNSEDNIAQQYSRATSIFHHW